MFKFYWLLVGLCQRAKHPRRVRAEAPCGGFARVVSPPLTSSQRVLSVDSAVLNSFVLYFLLLNVFVCEVFMLSIVTKMFARVEDAVHGLCSCSSFSGSCFRPFRRYASFRNFCVGGQSIHVTFSTRAADMYTDMRIVDRGATATSGIQGISE